jgi:nicotinate-nucleotide adenylyltransferase
LASSSIGILGGTFDPVHNAHLAMARAAFVELRLERILWIPTGAPTYRTPPVAAARHRVAMLRLALDGEPNCAIDERELAPGHSGYTVDTLVSLHRDFPGSEFHLLMGADQYAKLGTWHRPKELGKLCRIAVFARPGWTIAGGAARLVPFEACGISASDIRARIGRGEDVSAMIPAAVLRYIASHRLYGHP